MLIRTSADAARIVKTARVKQGVTQGDLAERVGITRQSLVRIEQGSGGTSLDTYLRLFDVLGLGLEALTQRARASEQDASSRDVSTRRAGRETAQELVERSGSVKLSEIKHNNSSQLAAKIEALRRKVEEAHIDLPQKDAS